MAIEFAIITGASSGIGRAAAIELARRGVSVALLGRRRDALAEVKSLCPGSSVWEIELNSPPEIAALVTELRSIAPAGSVGLVNAAGVAQFEDFEKGEPAHQIETNLTAPLNLIREILPWLLSNGTGHRVISVSSIAAVHAFPGAATYSATKAGLLAASKCLNAEFRSRGIHFTTIIAGATDTALWDDKHFVPKREDMLRPEAVGELIADLLLAPPDRAIDEVTIMPPKGIL
ncbi:MAG: SDR family NAD(P)-dependent oxidoreductase [Fimbriimonadaceae bacterium]